MDAVAGPNPLLCTARLEAVAPDPALADAVLDFYQRNREHLGPWDPRRDEAFYTLEHHRAALERAAEAWLAGHGYAWWLRLADAPGVLIGQMHFSSIARGVFHNAQLGYAIDGRLEGRGLMTEALAAGIAEVFAPAVSLHRVQAAYRPENRRSGAILARLGFEREGLAREYLFIDGAWRDHVITALRNAAWRPPA